MISYTAEKWRMAQVLLDRFIDRWRVRPEGSIFPFGSEMDDLSPADQDQFLEAADAMLYNDIAVRPSQARKEGGRS